jgi:hypothetical protein
MRTTVTLAPTPATPEFRAPHPTLVETRPPNKFFPYYKTNPKVLTIPLYFTAKSGLNTQFFQRSQASRLKKFPLTTITNCNMRLGEKIRYLREVEGALRGLDRAMTELEIAHAIKELARPQQSDSHEAHG